MIRIMGLDFGSKTVGVAVSDPLGITAQGIEIVRRTSENKLRKTLARIEALVAEYQVTEFVLGLPKNMNGTIGPRAQTVMEFADALKEKIKLPIHFWDERLTTVEAHKMMIDAGMRRDKRKKNVDRIAAVLILQGFLDYRNKA